MLFLRMSVLVILLAKPLYNVPPQQISVDCESLVMLGDKSGLQSVERIINPLSLLYLDTAYASRIVDWEFSRGFLGASPLNPGYMELNIPGYTIDISSNLGNRHAASKLLQYYCSVPKKTCSDTIFWMYQQMYMFLPVFVLRKPYSNVLEKRLRSDFERWISIASSVPPVKYPDPSIDYDRQTELNPASNTQDARFISLQLGLALQDLGSQGFGEGKIHELRRMQACLGNARFQLPAISGSNRVYTDPIETDTVSTIREYQAISKIIEDKAEMKLIITSWLDRHGISKHQPYSQSKYLVKQPRKAYFEIYYEFGMQALRLTLLDGNKLKIEKMMEAAD